MPRLVLQPTGFARAADRLKMRSPTDSAGAPIAGALAWRWPRNRPSSCRGRRRRRGHCPASGRQVRRGRRRGKRCDASPASISGCWPRGEAGDRRRPPAIFATTWPASSPAISTAGRPLQRRPGRHAVDLQHEIAVVRILHDVDAGIVGADGRRGADGEIGQSRRRRAPPRSGRPGWRWCANACRGGSWRRRRGRR